MRQAVCYVLAAICSELGSEVLRLSVGLELRRKLAELLPACRLDDHYERTGRGPEQTLLGPESFANLLELAAQLHALSGLSRSRLYPDHFGTVAMTVPPAFV